MEYVVLNVKKIRLNNQCKIIYDNKLFKLKGYTYEKELKNSYNK